MTSYQVIPKSIRARELAILVVGLIVTACSGAPAAPSASTLPAVVTASSASLPSPSPNGSPATSPVVAPAPATTIAPTPIDGLWEVTTTRAELLAAGAGPDEDSPDNYGHSFQEFHNGTWGGTEVGGTVGTYRLDGNKILLTLTTTDEVGTTFAGTWELVGDMLTFGGDIPTPMRVKPYTRVVAP